ncbi:MAG: hypothetical protein IT423_00645, partial [Pirellulaceae bacterium]|nr:hypothetical protein [Pirellulaceae bacterium]
MLCMIRRWSHALAMALATLGALGLGNSLWAQGGAGGGGQDSAPAFAEQDFREKMWEAGGPRLNQIATGKLVLGVEIVGNQKISQHKILSHMQTRPDRLFDEKQLQADIHELYRTELFRKIEPSKRETAEGVYIRLQVTEEPLVSEVIFHGNERL